MIVTTSILSQNLSNYKNKNDKISRMIKNKELYPINKGIYETDKSTSPIYLTGYIYGPSYVSFDYALSRYGLIPEAVYEYTSATCEKKKKRFFKNYFGNYSYRDIPVTAFPFGINLIEEKGYSYRIATPEKALCDKLYTLSPVKNKKELEALLFDDLRIDKDEFNKLNKDDIIFLSNKYKSTNIRLLVNYVRRQISE